MEYIKKQETFHKIERLSSTKVIAELFEKGNSLYSFPFKIFFLQEQCTKDLVLPNQILISVSKKYFKRAVDRNTIKRITREIYRKNKQKMMSEENIHLKIAFVYTHREILTYKEIEKKVNLVFHKVLQSIKNK